MGKETNEDVDVLKLSSDEIDDFVNNQEFCIVILGYKSFYPGRENDEIVMRLGFSQQAAKKILENILTDEKISFARNRF